MNNHSLENNLGSLLLFLVEFDNGVYYYRGGLGSDESSDGENGTVTGKACPKGLYGIFCKVGFLCMI